MRDNTLETLLKMSKADRERYIKFAKKMSLFTHIDVEDCLVYLLDRRLGLGSQR